MRTSHSTIPKSALILGSAVAVVGLVAAAPAHAATSGSSGQCNGQKMQMKPKCQGRKMDQGSAMSRHQAVNRTNSTTGASSREPAQPMSGQKANQPIAAPKTQ